MKKIVLKITNRQTGEYLLSHTNNSARRIRELMRDIDAVNGRIDQRSFERFNIFKGCNATDADIEIEEFTYARTLAFPKPAEA